MPNWCIQYNINFYQRFYSNYKNVDLFITADIYLHVVIIYYSDYKLLSLSSLTRY